MTKKETKPKTDKKTPKKKTEKAKTSEKKVQDTKPDFGFPAMMNGQYIKDLSFENPAGPMAIIAAQARPEVQVNIDMDYQKLEIKGREEVQMYEVQLHIRVVASAQEKTAFIVELSHATSCTIRDLPTEKLDFFLRTEIPRFAFPFVRQIIADITAQGGFQPLYLAPINFVALYQQKTQSKQASNA